MPLQRLHELKLLCRSGASDYIHSARFQSSIRVAQMFQLLSKQNPRMVASESDLAGYGGGGKRMVSCNHHGVNSSRAAGLHRFPDAGPDRVFESQETGKTKLRSGFCSRIGSSRKLPLCHSYNLVRLVGKLGGPALPKLPLCARQG
jgi:hypothetical protein